ncbi:MAG: TraB/GumN family protein [Anaerolineaceae bacterium]|nr:MAG: TraB/GumN family protein [Anaerolineaceae bacterium]
MKKRFLSLLLIISMLLTVLPANSAFAQEADVAQPTYSQWAFEDLVVGDTYNIYPQRWYKKGMQDPITHAQLRVLMAGIRIKLNSSESVVNYNEQIYNLSDDMTVEEVLEALYLMISNYEFNKDIGITEDGKALDYMAKYGIYTGNEGGLSLKDICTVEQACVIATRLITYMYDALDAASKGFLWEIESGDNKVYLLGSIHMADYDIYPFSNKMLEAFAESDVLGVEVNLLDTSVDVNNLFMTYGMYNDGTSLIDHVSEETYVKTIQVGAAFGLEEEVLALFKPWALFNTFVGLSNTSEASIDEATKAAQLGVDMKFLLDAYFAEKPIVELESYELQIKLLDSFSDKLAEYLLDSTMDSIIDMMQGVKVEGGNQAINIILDYWHEGDVEGFMRDIAPLLVASEVPDMDEEDKEIVALMEEYFYKIFTDRDKGMAKKIDEFLNAGGSTTYFVVVGTGHYISDYSVLDILEEMGYEINQIK